MTLKLSVYDSSMKQFVWDVIFHPDVSIWLTNEDLSSGERIFTNDTKSRAPWCETNHLRAFRSQEEIPYSKMLMIVDRNNRRTFFWSLFSIHVKYYKVVREYIVCGNLCWVCTKYSQPERSVCEHCHKVIFAQHAMMLMLAREFALPVELVEMIVGKVAEISR